MRHSLFLILVWLIAAEIVSFNAIHIGKVRLESEYAGAMRRLWTLVSAWVTAAGFVWCIVFAICLVGLAAGQLELSTLTLYVDQSLWLLAACAMVHVYYYIARDRWAVNLRNRMVNLDPALSRPFINTYRRYHAIDTFKAALTDTCNDFFVNKDPWWRVSMVLLTIATLGAAPLLTSIFARYAATAPLPTPATAATD
jgi:hypothetical protein